MHTHLLNLPSWKMMPLLSTSVRLVSFSFSIVFRVQSLEKGIHYGFIPSSIGNFHKANARHPNQKSDLVESPRHLMGVYVILILKVFFFQVGLWLLHAPIALIELVYKFNGILPLMKSPMVCHYKNIFYTLELVFTSLFTFTKLEIVAST